MREDSDPIVGDWVQKSRQDIGLHRKVPQVPQHRRDRDWDGCRRGDGEGQNGGKRADVTKLIACKTNSVINPGKETAKSFGSLYMQGRLRVSFLQLIKEKNSSMLFINGFSDATITQVDFPSQGLISSKSCCLRSPHRRHRGCGDALLPGWTTAGPCLLAEDPGYVGRHLRDLQPVCEGDLNVQKLLGFLFSGNILSI